MGSKAFAFLGVFLLSLGTLCGPGLWLMAIACSYTAWLPGLEDATRLALLYASFVFGCWALWGLVSGLARLSRTFLALGSIVNLGTGFFIFVSEQPHAKAIGVLFLGYSLIQLIAARRPYVHIVS